MYRGSERRTPFRRRYAIFMPEAGESNGYNQVKPSVTYQVRPP